MSFDVIRPLAAGRSLQVWVLAGLVSLMGCMGIASAQTAPVGSEVRPKVGVFYFPGWKAGARGLAYPEPWKPIQRFPEREPLLGWYDEGKLSVMEQHLAWMAGHALDYVVFDWYWDGSEPVLGHALRAYASSAGKAKVQYSLMWANHEEKRYSEREIRDMAEHMASQHFRRPEYLKVNGRPLFFVMGTEQLERNAQALGVPHARLTEIFQSAAKKAGLPGVLLLAAAGGGANPVTSNARRWGYDAYFVYDYSAGMMGTRGQPRGTHSYEELEDVYREHWTWFMTRADMPYVVPMTAGFDRRPWGGSADPRHDLSVSTVEQFTRHINAGYDVIRRHPTKTLGMGLICCWNEFGEGAYIEPTKALGMSYIGAVKSVFGQP